MNAEERPDIVEGEEELNADEETGNDVPVDDAAVTGNEEGEDAENTQGGLKSSPDADTFFLITKPAGLGLGKIVMPISKCILNYIVFLKICRPVKMSVSWLVSPTRDRRTLPLRAWMLLSVMPWTLTFICRT